MRLASELGIGVEEGSLEFYWVGSVDARSGLGEAVAVLLPPVGERTKQEKKKWLLYAIEA